VLESIGVGRDIAVSLIGHFNHPAARRAERCGLIKAFSASEQDGTPEYDVPSREHARAPGRDADR
jgi:hypothetical protein